MTPRAVWTEHSISSRDKAGPYADQICQETKGHGLRGLLLSQ